MPAPPVLASSAVAGAAVSAAMAIIGAEKPATAASVQIRANFRMLNSRPLISFTFDDANYDDGWEFAGRFLTIRSPFGESSRRLLQRPPPSAVASFDWL